MNEQEILKRITVNPKIIRGRRLAIEHILGMLAAGYTVEPSSSDILAGEGRRLSLPDLCPALGGTRASRTLAF